MLLDCCAIGPSTHMCVLHTHAHQHKRVEPRATDKPSRSDVDGCSGGVDNNRAVLCLKLGTGQDRAHVPPTLPSRSVRVPYPIALRS